MPGTSAIDPSLCPLCGKANRCAMELERQSSLEQPALLVHAGGLQPFAAGPPARDSARQGLHLRGLRRFG